MTTVAENGIAKEPVVRIVLTITVSTLLVSACAGQPVSQPGATAAAPAASIVPTHSTAPRVAGYVRVVKGGTVRYCRNDLQTGSHLVVETTCLSEQEFAALEDQTRRDVERIRGTMSGSNPM